MDAQHMLDGLTVLDLSQGIAGPCCAYLLRQQGARVIKVEPPSGDWGRQMGRVRDGQSAISIAYNVGKESVVLDTRSDEGRRDLQAIARGADLVVQNFRPGVVDRMGVGYEELARRNPALVYVSISGFGASGPLVRRPALDTTMQALGGLMHTNRDAAGHPRRIGFFLVDLSTGLYAAQNACAALYRSARTGRGRHIELSLLETSAALQSYLVLDEAMFPGDEQAAFNAPTGLFPAADGLIYISMLDDAMFLRLARVLGRGDWAADASLHTSAGRLPRAAELNQALAALVATRTVGEWETLLLQADILFGRVQQPRDLRTMPQAQHVGLFGQLEQPGFEGLPVANLPGQAGAAAPQGQAPALGEHTDAVLREFSRR